MGDFGSDFGADFDGGVGAAPPVEPPPPPPPLLPSFEMLRCPEVEILTGNSLDGLGSTATALYPDYLALRGAFANYSGLASGHADYADVMTGHPGFSDGLSAAGSRGFGLHLGIRDSDGVEWWVSEVEGWDSGPMVDPVELEAVASGTWIDRVRAKGREVTLKGWVIAPNETRLVRAKRLLAAALATPPHFGVMRVGGAAGLRLPVALAEGMKVKQISETVAEFEVDVKGRDAGTPGAGVWLEGTTRDVVMAPTSTVTVTTDSFVSSRPFIRMQGPLSAGQELSDGRAVVRLAEALTSGQLLLIDCATWQVSLLGGALTVPVPARFMLTGSSSRIEIDPVSATLTSSGASIGGQIIVTITDIY